MLTKEVVDEGMVPASPLEVFEEIIVAKLQSSIMTSSESFHNNVRPMLKSFVAVQTFFVEALALDYKPKKINELEKIKG